MLDIGRRQGNSGRSEEGAENATSEVSGKGDEVCDQSACGWPVFPGPLPVKASLRPSRHGDISVATDARDVVDRICHVLGILLNVSEEVSGDVQPDGVCDGRALQERDHVADESEIACPMLETRAAEMITNKYIYGYELTCRASPRRQDNGIRCSAPAILEARWNVNRCSERLF